MQEPTRYAGADTQEVDMQEQDAVTVAVDRCSGRLTKLDPSKPTDNSSFIPGSLLDGDYWRSAPNRPPQRNTSIPPTAPSKKRAVPPTPDEIAELKAATAAAKAARIASSTSASPLSNVSSSLFQDKLVPSRSSSWSSSHERTRAENREGAEDDQTTPRPPRSLTQSALHTLAENFAPRVQKQDLVDLASSTLGRIPDLIADKLTMIALSQVESSDPSRLPSSSLNEPPDLPSSSASNLRIRHDSAPPSHFASFPSPGHVMSSSSHNTVAAEIEELKRQNAELKKQLDAILSRQSEADRIAAIKSDLAEQRRAAYSAANLPLPPLNQIQERRTARSPSVIEEHDKQWKLSPKSIGYLKPLPTSDYAKSWEAVDKSDTYVRPYAWLQKVRTKMEQKDDMMWKAKVLEVAFECLQGSASKWWTAIGGQMRTRLLADFTLKLWYEHMECLCPSRENMRREAFARKWNPATETCMDYVWEKAAMFNEIDNQGSLSEKGVVSEILKGLPPTLAQQVRTDFDPNASVEMLSRESQHLLPRWEKTQKMQRPLARSSTPATERKYTQRTVGQTLNEPSLAASYNKSKISTKEHPVTKKMVRSYMKPNGRTIFLNRACSKCGKDNLDFEHDSSPKALVSMSTDEYGYDEMEEDSYSSGSEN
ncbi:hypothetical protein DFH27DRAFT_626243 [Peziza echinospora]|nr:hypothetical protein DFH27DRAFT_626243 [Peziza echinospora]